MFQLLSRLFLKKQVQCVMCRRYYTPATTASPKKDATTINVCDLGCFSRYINSKI